MTLPRSLWKQSLLRLCWNAGRSQSRASRCAGRDVGTVGHGVPQISSCHAGRSPAWGGTEALAAGLHSHGTEATLDHLVTPTCSRTAIRRTVWNDKVLFTPQSAGWTFHIDSKLNISPFSAQMFLTHRWGRGLGGAPWCAWPGGRAPPSCSRGTLYFRLH